MLFTISAPKPARPIAASAADSESDSDSGSGGGANLGRDRRAAKGRRDETADVVTPGEFITDDPQWMRGHGTHLHPSTSAITASVAGTLSRTNKLLAVRALRARFTPEVGDLVVGRIVEVLPRRWRVDVGAPQLAALPLSAINLPGGVLRKRTETDELQIRTFFSEGDLLVAEVQQLYADGGAVLHTRSLKYGKLRNGMFAALSGGGQGGGGGVVRSRRQVWDFDPAEVVPSVAGGARQRIEVVLGVNGYCFVGARAAALAEGEAGRREGVTGITNMEDAVSASVYASQNDPLDEGTMREIARVRSVIVALAENGLRVDEETVMAGYQIATEEAMNTEATREGGGDEGEDYLGGDKGRMLVDELLAGKRKAK